MAERASQSRRCYYEIGRAVSWDDTTQVKAPPPSANTLEPMRAEAYLIVLAGGSVGEMYKLGRERTIIGRGASADIRMLDEGISREHCEVLRQADRVILRDLRSTNGTFCRGLRVEEQDLSDGDKILVGSGTVLKFTYHDKLDEDFQRQMLDSALRDDLTRTFNKRYFQDRIESEYAYAIRHNLATALISFDLDHFKSVNDTYGHPAGDHALEQVAGVVFGTIRVEDVFARVGGEEFSIICRGADLLQAKIVAERIRRAVETHPVSWNEKSIPLTVSVGVVAIPSGSIRSAADFIAAADEMLYEAKRGGRNRVTLWNR
jgi:two-component system cell cycle response regulator